MQVITTRRGWAALAIVLVYSPVPAATAATSPCLPRAELAGFLAERYGERPMLAGSADGGGVMELFARADGASWTIAVHLPSGVSCLLAVGEALRPAAPASANPTERRG